MKYSIVVRQCDCCAIAHKVFLINEVFKVRSKYEFVCALTGLSSSFKADIQVFEDGYAIISENHPDFTEQPELKMVMHSTLAKKVSL